MQESVSITGVKNLFSDQNAAPVVLEIYTNKYFELYLTQ